METQRIIYLLNGLRENTVTPKEHEELSQLLKEDKHRQLFSEAIAGMMKTQEAGVDFDTSQWQKIVEDIVSIDKTDTKKETGKIIRFSLFRRWAVSAAILFAIAVPLYFLLFNIKEQKKVAKQETQEQRLANLIKPGTKGGILTLSDGSKIVLDSAFNGSIAKQGNTAVVKQDGQLVYNLGAETNQVLYNTMTTPAGRQYSLVLADGTHAWLNAASSITFPASFTGKERNVEITGEVYFEVAKNSGMPFNVKVNDMVIEVLGTHFNVNAYNNEAAIKTTLLEGSVKISSIVNSRETIILKPGQQALLTYDSGIFKVINDADTEEALAWKNGMFSFNGTNIQTIMRQAARWYDVEVSYLGDVSRTDFSGAVSMSANVSDLLYKLELTKAVRFKIEGRKIIVMP